MGNCASACPYLVRTLIAAAALVLVGCAAAPPAPEAPPPVVAEPTPEPVAAPAPIEPPPTPTPEPAPVAPPRAEIVVIVDPSASSYAAVGDAIVAELSPRLYDVTLVVSTATDSLAAARDHRVTVIAVGAAAVTAARTELPGKDLVFCQVLAHESLVGDSERTWGVRALPPLALQLRGWRAVDPSLRTIALIVSDASAALAAEAQQAAGDTAADLLVQTSSSDRETLYLFRRIAADVDGLWLLPDGAALSPSALREILSYAAARGIGVLTFSEALLPRGALLSATSVAADVATTVHRIVERVVAGRTRDLPAMTPLSAVEFAINKELAATLGLPPVMSSRWVTRDPD